MPFTKEQGAIVNHVEGHAKVVATAGSGKSTVMVARTGTLISSGVEPRYIMSVMFNSDARDSYEAKLIKKYGNCSLPVFTFHGLGSHLISILVKNGLIKSAVLKTFEWDAIKVARIVIDPYLQKFEGLNRTTTVNEFLTFVDLKKSTLDMAAEVFSEYEFSSKYRFFVEAYKKFEKERKKQNIRFFSDLIYDPVNFLIQNPEHQSLVSDIYKHIIVDECQDINDIQQEMIKIIAGKNTTVMVVGDDDQCIYTWRGARPDYLVSGFERVFKNPTIFKMSTTFRYGHQISLAANYLIKNNKIRVPKLCVSSSAVKPSSISMDLETIGQASVPAAVDKWLASGRKVTEIAVLVRSYSQAISVELGLLCQGTAYRMEGGTPVFSSEDIGAVVATLHIATRFKALDDNELGVMANFFVGYPSLGLTQDDKWSLLREAKQDPKTTPEILGDTLYKVQEKWVRRRIENRIEAWRNLTVMGNKPLITVIDFAMEAMGINHQIEYESKNIEQKEEAIRRFDAFKQYANHFSGTLIEFVQHIEALRLSQLSVDDEALLITSVHRSKGCEWPFVIMPNLVQGRFPLFRNGNDSPKVIEDERRLFFTGMTRAQEHLKLIAPNDPQLTRYLAAGADFPPQSLSPSEATASQFLYECNIFISQRADWMVKGKQEPIAVKSPSMANKYVKRLGSKPVLTAA